MFYSQFNKGTSNITQFDYFLYSYEGIEVFLFEVFFCNLKRCAEDF